MVDRSLDSAAAPVSEERGLDLTAAFIGPLAAAARGLWVLFSATAFIELVGLALLLRAVWPQVADAEPRGSLWGGVVLVLLARIAIAFAARPLSDIALRQRSIAALDTASSPGPIALAAPLSPSSMLSRSTVSSRRHRFPGSSNSRLPRHWRPPSPA